MTSTETVTILFTDIVGSTELSSRLEPDEADRVRQAHFSLLRQALAASQGTEVKNLGDGLMAVFPSASAAVSCAVAMQQAVEHDNRRSAVPIGLRVGLSGGEVTVEVDDYFGDPVIEAARICALCEGGQILVTDTARSLAGRRSHHRFIDTGERELRGLPEPIPVFEVAWEPAVSTSGIPMPDRLDSTGASLFGFFGRQSEKEHLVEAIKSTAEGSHRVALVSGEPGIGKTSLCKEVARGTHELGVPVLYGRCDEDLVVSYQPFAEALNHLVVHATDSLLAEHVTQSGGALLGMVPAVAKRLPGVAEPPTADPDSERPRLFAAVVNLLSLASADQGLLLVLDDLHWADKASLQLLRHVASSTLLPKVMVIATYRPSDLRAGDQLSDTLASLRREASAERIDLVGLEDFAIIEMMERVAGHEMNKAGVDLAHAVRRETEGNPFFTTELLRHLGESGLVHQDETGHWVASDDLYERGLPQSVREVVGQRVDRLGEEMRPVLSQAAVIGRDFDINVLAAVAGIGEDTLLDFIDRGVDAGLLVEVEGTVERFSFAHALTQHTLYEDLGPTRCARTHRKVAQVLEQLYGADLQTRASELAHHFVAATKTADAVKAITYCKMAGDEALAQVAPADALGWFSQALDLYGQGEPDESIRCEILIGLGTSQRQLGEPSYRQTLLDAAAIAQTIGSETMLVRAALANNRGGVSASGVVDEDRVRVLHAALDAISTADGADRALLLATLAAELSFADDLEHHAALAVEALAMARHLDDPLTLLRVTSLVYHNFVNPENLQERLDDLARAVSIASGNADPAAAIRVNFTRAISCLQAGDRATFDTHVERCTQIVAGFDHPYESWSTESLLCIQALLDGDAVSAELHADKALAVGAEGIAEAFTTYGVQLIEIRRLQGRINELHEICDLMAQAAEENPGLPVLQIVLARMSIDLGRVDAARATDALRIAGGQTYFPHDITWLPGTCVLAGVCVSLEDADGARRLRGLLEPWHSQVACVGVSCEGPVAFALGLLSSMLGDYDAAETYLTEALEIAANLRAPYWIIRAGLSLAEVLRLRGHDDDLTRRAAVRSEAEVEAKSHGLEHLLIG